MPIGSFRGSGGRQAGKKLPGKTSGGRGKKLPGASSRKLSEAADATMLDAARFGADCRCRQIG
ncbi:MAG: hypothetical protein WC058_09255 [Phycisphaeraceae bacterium]